MSGIPQDCCRIVQSDELPQPPKSVPPTPVPTNISVADPFEIFKTHATMQTINAHLVPWLIAEFGSKIGTEYADFGNNKTATAIIAHVIMTEELGCYTDQTFPEMLRGHRVQQLIFTKFVLRQIGNCPQTFFGK